MSDKAEGAPRRIQRKRAKGWKMPPNTIYVGRPTKWGNPWQVGDVIDGQVVTPEVAVEWYRMVVLTPENSKRAAELRGKDLACWCPLDQPCHADVLLEIANG
jgi:hypothetical protein